MTAPSPLLDRLPAGRVFRVRAPAAGLAIWLAALLLFVLFWQFGRETAGWLFDYPKAWTLPAARWIGQFVKWLINDAAIGPVSFADATRFLSALIEAPYALALGLLSKGFGGVNSILPLAIPPLSWLAVTAFAALLGARWGGRRLAVLVGGCFLFLAAFGRWEPAMVTLASILVAVPLGVAGGLLLGLAAYRSATVDRLIRPLLDLMQTIPVFAYLVPILVLFGFGPPAAIVATVIFAMPPMTRVTLLALRAVPPEAVDLGRMVGATRRQMTWRVLVPSAREALMVGVNQVIMLSLNMVIIASMIGAGGLGFDVLAALRRLDIGGGIEAGMAIVALAVALDRLSEAFAARAGAPAARRSLAGSPLEAGLLVLFVAAVLVGLALPALRTYPDVLRLSTGAVFSDLVRWINVNYFDVIEGVKNLVLLNVLVPLKRLMAELPWAGVAAFLAFVGWRLSGWRLALLVVSLLTFVAATGQWEKASVTVYLCGVSVLAAMAIGLPVGILAAEKERFWPYVRAAIDTLQVLPSFVYLMPAVMLFRVGDFTAIVAVILFAAVPAIRYTAIGLREVDALLVEAARAMGATKRQILWKVKLKLALPAILLGVNQTIMFALSMLVITALVGTRDLGQEVYIALTKADPGRGVVAGLAIACLAITADRLVSAGAGRMRARLGLA